MKRTLFFLLLPVLTGVVSAQDAEAPKEEPQPVRTSQAIEILERADAAIKSVHSVRAEIKTEVSGVATNFVSAAEGTAVFVGWTGRGPEKSFRHVKTADPESGESVELTSGGNGETYFLINHNEKKGYEDMDPGVMGSSGRALGSFGMIEFVHDAPFDDELAAESVEYEGESDVAGEACHKIRVTYAGDQGSSTWFFSKKDFLPRRRIQHFNFQGQDGAVEINLSKLETNIEPGDDLFRMKLPEGYVQIDDFAP